jgi:diguanylate cyclase (GGDEF)-like protein/PAS domain S-box-containing protein
VAALVVLSLLVDAAALVGSVLFLRRLGDRRLGFFAALVGLLAALQVLALRAAPPAVPDLPIDDLLLRLGLGTASLGASAFALLAVVFAGRELGERQRSQRELRLEKAYLEKLFDSAPEAVVLLDNQDRVLRVNPEFERLFQYSAAESVGRTMNDLIATDEARGEATALSTRVAGGFTVNVETVRRRKDGRLVHVSILGAPIVTEDGQVAIYGIYRDITVRKEAEEALRASEERYALAARGAGAGLWDWDVGRDRVYFSPRWKEMLGYDDWELGDQLSEWLSRVHPEDLAGLEGALAVHLEGRSTHLEHEHRVLHKNGTYPWMLVRGMAVRGAEGRPTRLAGSLTDVTERRLAEEQLRHAALHDGLTGLPNRALFSEILGRAFRRRESEPDYGFAVLFLDIDRFKLVNDSLGHMVGDRVLVTLGQRLRSCLRSGDVVARLGGDEFIVFLDRVTDVEIARRTAERIQGQIAEPLEVEGQEVVLSAGIGIALSDGPGEAGGYDAPEDVLRGADIAMYRTKLDGGGGSRVFHPEMHAEAVARLRLESDLRRAVERGEIAVHYQPVLELGSGRVAGFEALARWHHPTRGLLLPGEFIATAEETGMIVELGEQVLRSACRQLRAWGESVDPEGLLTVSVNLSARQFRDRALGERVVAAVEEAGIDPARLAVEITESALLEANETNAEGMRALREAGVQVHIDDFGTGYSSLGYLHRFSIQALKIDRSFVRELEDGAGNREIVEAIVTLASNLGLGVIAEGVESDGQLQVLRRLRCTLGQGFLFAPAVEPEEAERLVRERGVRRPETRSSPAVRIAR